MVRPLLVTLSHHGLEFDLTVRAEGAVTVGDLTTALIEQAELDRRPPNPTLAVQRTGLTLPPQALLADSDLHSGDLIRLSDSSNATEVNRRDVAAVAEVAEGPDAGRSFDLGPGLNDIGRSHLCDVHLSDPMVSRRHARVRVDAGVSVRDLGATNGVLVNGERIDAPAEIGSNDAVTIGGTVLRIQVYQPEGPRIVGPEVQFNRPPRVFKPFSGTEVTLPAPPEDPPRQYLPMVAAVIPLIMGLVMWQVFGSLIFALFMLMSPLMLLGSYYESRKSGRRDHKRRLEEHALLLSRALAQLDALQDEEIDSRRREFPTAEEAAGFACELSTRLWERQPDDEAFLVLRIGSAEQDSRIAVSVQPGGSRRLRDELEDIPPRYARFKDLPAVAGLQAVGVLGIAGGSRSSAALARALLIQVCCLHAPTEVAVAAFLNPAQADRWRWLQWLPHVHGLRSRVARTHFGIDEATCGELAEDLNALLDRRLKASAGSRGKDGASAPAVVVFVEDEAPLDRSKLTRLLESGSAVGIYHLWVSPHRQHLPRACGAVVDLTGPDGGGDSSTVGFRDSGAEVSGVEINVIAAARAEESARALAPVTEVGGSVDAEAVVPASARLVHLLDGVGAMDDVEVIHRRWARSEDELAVSGRLRLDAPVGLAADAPMVIDLRSDGPHALVAGHDRRRQVGTAPVPRRVVGGYPQRAAGDVPARGLQGRRCLQGLRGPAPHGGPCDGPQHQRGPAGAGVP